MANNAQKQIPILVYIPILLAAVLPWLGYLLVRYDTWQQKGYIFIFYYGLSCHLFFSITKGKLLTYILPCIAPIAVLMAAYIEKY